MFRSVPPQSSISDRELEGGMRALVLDGVFIQSHTVLTTGAFLIGFALALGASNSVIGVLAALAALALAFQIPAVYLVQRLRWRKCIVLVAATLSRSMWLVMAAIPFVLERRLQIPVFLGALMVHYTLGNIGGCAFNSWIRDLIPQGRLGEFFSRRMTLATAVGALVSLAAGFGVDAWKLHLPGAPGGAAGAYVAVFLLAMVFGMLSVHQLFRAPEPVMPPGADEPFLRTLRQPLRDRNFRQVLIFLGAWNFALNFATPFFAVYLLQRLGMDMSWVIGLTVLSQAVNVLFFQFWGRLADRFSHKAVLAVSAPLFIFSFLLWPFTTMPEQYFLTIPLLLLIHIMAGVGTAGVNLCTGNLALRLAPYGKAGAYLAVNSLVSGLAAAVSPVIAGFSADWFDSRQLALTLHYASTAPEGADFVMPAMDLRGLDFLFFIAFFLGLYAMHRLVTVREEGEVKESELRRALLDEMGRAVRQVSTVAGVRQMIMAPFTLFRAAPAAKPEDQSPDDGDANTS